MKNRIFDVILGLILLMMGLTTVLGIGFAACISNFFDFLGFFIDVTNILSREISTILITILNVSFGVLLIVTGVLLLRRKNIAYKLLLLLSAIFFIVALANLSASDFNIFGANNYRFAEQIILALGCYFLVWLRKSGAVSIGKGFQKFILFFLVIGLLAVFSGYFLIRNILNVSVFSYDDKSVWEITEITGTAPQWRRETVLGMQVDIPTKMLVYKREVNEAKEEKVVFLREKTDSPDTEIGLIFGRNILVSEGFSKSYRDAEQLFQSSGLMQLYFKSRFLSGKYQKITHANWQGFVGKTDEKAYRAYLWGKDETNNLTNNLEIWFTFNKVAEDFDKREFIDTVINSLTIPESSETQTEEK